MRDLYYLLIVAALAAATWLLAEAFARLSPSAEGRK
jgi:hypothetical protein